MAQFSNSTVGNKFYGNSGEICCGLVAAVLLMATSPKDKPTDMHISTHVIVYTVYVAAHTHTLTYIHMVRSYVKVTLHIDGITRCRPRPLRQILKPASPIDFVPSPETLSLSFSYKSVTYTPPRPPHSELSNPFDICSIAADAVIGENQFSCCCQKQA